MPSYKNYSTYKNFKIPAYNVYCFKSNGFSYIEKCLPTDAPVCTERRDGELFGALKHETVSIHCSVDANPALVSFHWTFNNSGEQTEIPPR